MDLTTSFGIRYADSEVDSDLEPLVLLHGLGNSVNFWQLVYPRIKHHRRVVAMDIPGFGLSATPDDGFTIEAVAADVCRMLEHLGVADAVVCGHSMGAVVALQLGAAHRRFTSGVVLVDGHLLSAIEALKKPIVTLIRDRRLLWAVAAQFLGGLLPIPQSVAGFVTRQPTVRRLVFGPFVASPEALDPEATKEALKHTGGRNVARTFCIAGRMDLADLMSQVSVPVSLIWGSEDRLLRPPDLERARRLMNLVSVFEIDGAGHWPMLESPAVLAELLAGYSATRGFPTPHDA